MAAYYTNLARPLMHWHARRSHIYRPWMKSQLKVFVSGYYQQLLGPGREKGGLEPSSLKIICKNRSSESINHGVSSM